MPPGHFIIYLFLGLTIIAAAQVDAKKRVSGRISKAAPQRKVRKYVISCCGKTRCSGALKKRFNISQVASPANQFSTNEDKQTKTGIVPAISFTESTTLRDSRLTTQNYDEIVDELDEVKTDYTGSINTTEHQNTQNHDENTTTQRDRLSSKPLDVPVSSTTSEITLITEINTNTTETTTEEATTKEITTTSPAAAATTITTPTTTSTTPKTTTPVTTTTSTTTSTTPSSTTSSSSPPTTTTTITMKPSTILTFESCSKGIDINASLFDAYKNLKNPENYGTWKTEGANLLLFGRKIGTWEENRGLCFQIGMKPMSLDETRMATFKNWTSTWKQNFKYWTFGRIFNGVFSFCDGANVTKNWGRNQPNMTSGAECVALNFDQTLLTAYFTNYDCKRKTFFACEGTATTSAPSLKPNYRTINCTKNPTLFNSFGQGADDLRDVDKYGIWRNYSGRTYLFSKSTDKQTYSGAMQTCCAIKMNLLHLKQDYIYDSLVKLISGNPGTLNADLFWTSGTDEGSEGKWGFAISEELLEQTAKWAPNQPDNSGGNENCLAVNISEADYAFKDENCNAKYRYICVARETTGSTTAGRQAQRECAETFGIDEGALDSMMSNFNLSGTSSTNFRCFMKCMGETTNMVKNNNLIAEPFLRMMEAMYEDEDAKLESSLTNYDICSKSDGLDDCDRISKIYKCGLEKEPEVTSNVMQAADVSSSLQLNPILGIEAICPEFKCTVNEKLMIAFKKNKLPNIYTACNRKYLQSPTALFHKDAAAYCCTYGLKLVTLASRQDFNCLNQLTLNPRYYVMLGVSRLRRFSKPRNCFSPKPFDWTLYPWEMTYSNSSSYFFLVHYLEPSKKVLRYHWTDAYVLCEE